MSERHAEKMQRLIDTVLSSPGASDPALRRAVATWAATLGGHPAGKLDEVPAPLVAYIEKVALHAYKITDDDIAALRQAGYSEDAVFELTVSAALGAGMARLERGLKAFKGGMA